MTPYEQVREACIVILQSIVSLPNYFGQTKFSLKLPKDIQTKLEMTLQPETKESAKSKPLPEITTYSAVSRKLKGPYWEFSVPHWENLHFSHFFLSS